MGRCFIGVVIICGVVLSGLFIAGCGSKTVKISDEDMQIRLDQLSPEEREQLQQMQEAMDATTQMIQDEHGNVPEGLRLAVPPMQPASGE